MSRSAALPELTDVLQQLAEQAEQLAQMLSEQSGVLSSGSPDDLHDNTQRLMLRTQALEALEKQRRHLMTDRSQLSDAQAALWQRCLDALMQCRQGNRHNADWARQQLRQTQAALDILQGPQQRLRTYDTRGRAQTLHHIHHLGEA